MALGSTWLAHWGGALGLSQGMALTGAGKTVSRRTAWELGALWETPCLAGPTAPRTAWGR